MQFVLPLVQASVLTAFASTGGVQTHTHTQSQEQRWSKCVYSICLTGLPMACPEAKIIAYHHIDVILLII